MKDNTAENSEIRGKRAELERRPTFAEIDLRALNSNYQYVKSLAASRGIIAIVKADAYGHGLIPISRELERLGVDYLGVGFLEEGVALREAGIKCPVLALGGVAGYQIDHFLDYDLELTASSRFIAGEIDRRARRMNKKAKVHLKIDTGLNRIGVNYRRAGEFLQFAAGLSHTEITGVYSHLASSDTDYEFTKLQIDRLLEIKEYSRKIFSSPVPFHMLNSAGLINFPEADFEYVRPGLLIYGLYPEGLVRNDIPLKPVMSLKSEVVFVKRVAVGETISYGRMHTVSKETTIITIPIGYGDGYMNRLSGCGEVLIGGKRYPVVGRVCMDQIMVDVGDDRVQMGGEVVLLGSQGNDRTTVEDICRVTGAIPYEVTIGITRRVPRVYIGNE